MLERVARTIDARPLAVPHGKHALDLGTGIERDLLRAEHGSGAKILVHGGQELDPVLFELHLAAPHLHVERAQRRAAIARDETGGGQPCRPVAARLVEHDPHQRLRAGQEHAASGLPVAILQRIGGERPGRLRGLRGGVLLCDVADHHHVLCSLATSVSTSYCATTSASSRSTVQSQRTSP